MPLLLLLTLGLGITAIALSQRAPTPKPVKLTPGGGPGPGTVPPSEIILAKQRLYTWAQSDGKGAIRPPGYPTADDLSSPFADFRFVEAITSFQKWANSMGVESIPGLSPMAKSRGLGAQWGFGVYDQDTNIALQVAARM